MMSKEKAFSVKDSDENKEMPESVAVFPSVLQRLMFCVCSTNLIKYILFRKW